MKLFDSVVWPLMKLAYRIKLRKLLFDAINDPESGIDDAVIGALDYLFEYKND